MPSEPVRRRLEHIRDNIALVRAFIGTMTFESFAGDRKTIYAVIRALEVISEATRHLDADVRSRHPHIDWVSVRDAGNVYRHGYDAVTEQRFGIRRPSIFPPCTWRF
ncbi:MAG TPA: HepT-like ribonuclease domain-containing protein [Rhizomicrobium sp.]